MYEARAVAKTMIDLAAERNLSVTNLTLQKLLYFAHGLMLVRSGDALVDEPFQAWKYGPVVESLYHDLKIFGTSQISPDAGYIPNWPGLPPDEASVARRAIADVLDQLGGMSGGQLINVSHDPNGPWNEVYKAATRNIKIENEKIKRYFQTIVKA